MDVPLSCLSARYHNFWENKADNNHQKDTNIAFFMHAEVLHQVVWNSHGIRAVTVLKYDVFIKFQDDAHDITLLPTKDPLKQVHHADFMVTNEDVDAIINLWPRNGAAH